MSSQQRLIDVLVTLVRSGDYTEEERSARLYAYTQAVKAEGLERSELFHQAIQEFCMTREQWEAARHERREYEKKETAFPQPFHEGLDEDDIQNMKYDGND